MTAPYNPWQTGGLPFLNVAATCPATRALGPGLRAVVWVQGCPFHCPGCVAPDWIPRRVAELLRPDDLAEELGARPGLTGLTFSGGEPMLQAAGLAMLARRSREQHDFSLICFTGFTLERLRGNPPGPGVAALLAEVDVLIDGLYIVARNDNRGLRGSTNQRIHYLTERITPSDDNFIDQPRQVEIHVSDGAALLVGVPPPGLPEAFHHAVTHANTTLVNARKGGSQ
jgi:anaerobic ribonucleoside-triphosphate reductase activating protein